MIMYKKYTYKFILLLFNFNVAINIERKCVLRVRDRVKWFKYHLLNNDNIGREWRNVNHYIIVRRRFRAAWWQLFLVCIMVLTCNTSNSKLNYLPRCKTFSLIFSPFLSFFSVFFFFFFFFVKINYIEQTENHIHWIAAY